MLKRKPIIIGNNSFRFKKDAISHYRHILNSYNFKESLDEPDFYDLIDLLNYDYLNNSDVSDVNESFTDEESDEKTDVWITDIKVSKVQYNTKCFEVFYSDNSSCYISYLMMINNTKYTPKMLFNEACRSAIHKDIRKVKQKYFASHSVKGHVKCQETGILSKWSELVIDHRQPNTFSVIVDRFKELNDFDLDNIDYKTDENNLILFKNENITNQFSDYHKEKANLRIVRKECNSGRASMARISRTKNDLKIR